MLTIEEIRVALKRVKIHVLAEDIGVHTNTLYRIANGHSEGNYSTLKKINDWLEALTDVPEADHD